MSKVSTQALQKLAASMPCLDNKPLHPPRFHKVNWTHGEKFSVQDDPDRVTYPWSQPDFLTNVDPTVRTTQTRLRLLSLPHGVTHGYTSHRNKKKQPNKNATTPTSTPPTTNNNNNLTTTTTTNVPTTTTTTLPSSFAAVVSNVFTEAECAQLIASVNEKGFTPALLNSGQGRQMLKPSRRDGWRVIVDTPQVSKWLLEVLRPHLPPTSNYASLSDINERFRFLCYTPGQNFPGHCDGRYTRAHSHPNCGDFSTITLQIYLHDVPEANGGATTFLGTDDRVSYQPKMGSVLMFTQDLYHEGSIVNAGLKYTLRTEVMYRPHDLH